MAGTLLDLARRMTALSKKIDKASSDLAVEATVAIIERLVVTTPVDTTAALSNWVVTLGSSSLSVIPPYAMGQQGSTRAISAQATIAAAKMVLKSKVPGQAIWITNNVPYIADLNRGSSSQAPRGFVQTAIAVAGITVRKRGLKLK